MASNLRIGVAGMGNIGRRHAESIASGRIARAGLAAVCSRSFASVRREDLPLFGSDARVFSDVDEMVGSGEVDAVVVATPTRDHVAHGIAALRSGIHVLMEKPLARSVAEAGSLVDAAGRDTVFAVMLNQRVQPQFFAIRQVLKKHVLGPIQRVSWTMTRWYRPDIYFKASAWRGTWAGEGGGALLNQCIHNLDVLQWLFGMPAAVTARCFFGKYHDIEVEDEVAAYFEFPLHHGVAATGTLVASTGEAPGINQLDIVGDLGTLRFDGNTVSLERNERGVREYTATAREMFGMPASEITIVEPGPDVDQHEVMLSNFVDAILDDAPLIAPAPEGLNSLEIANAILLSEWTRRRVELPFDVDQYETKLQERIASSRLRTPDASPVKVDMNKSFR